MYAVVIRALWEPLWRAPAPSPSSTRPRPGRWKPRAGGLRICSPSSPAATSPPL